MDRNPPQDPDRPRPRPSRWPARPRPPDDAAAGPGDPDATRPMPAADQPPRSRPYEPSRGARRLRDTDLPPAPRWARPRDAPPAAPPPRPAPSAPRRERPGTPPARSAPPAAPRRPRRTGLRRRPLLLGLFALIGVSLCAVLAPRIFRGTELYNDIFVTPPPRPAGTAGFPDWDKQERVNILLLGLDTRVPGDSRSDTMILVSIDPAHKTAALLSIPRDLWVPIPGNGTNRINAAYQFGETGQVPGGGPALAMQTVEQNLGVPVHYYAQVDFSGFRRIVDAFGGVTIDVQRPLIDNEYPADYGSAYQRIYIPAGLQHMDGRTALQYVRSRHSDSDLGRNARQQAVLLSLREEATQINILGKLDRLLVDAKGAVRTDLSLTQVGSLAKLAQSIPRDQVRQLAIGDTMVSQETVDGADVLLPHWDVIRPAVQTLFGQQDAAAEAAVVAVLNGTDTPGLALQTAARLRAAGLNVPAAAVGNPPDAGAGRYPQTYVLDFSSGQKPASLRSILGLLHLGADRVRPGGSAARPAGADIEVMLGEDAPK